MRASRFRFTERLQRNPRILQLSANRSSVDVYGASVGQHEFRRGRRVGHVPMPKYQPFITLPASPDRTLGGWDKNGVDTIFLAEIQSPPQTYVYRNDVQVGSFDWSDILPSSGYVYRAVESYVIHFGLILVAARRYESGVIKGVSLLWSHDYGATWNVQDFAGLPGYDGADRLNSWCIGQPYPTSIGSDAVSADLVFTDYLAKSGNPNGGQVFYCPLRRSSLSDTWTVNTGRMIWEDQKTGDTGRHFHTAAVVRGEKTGVIVHIGDVDYRNEIVFLDFDLDNYLTATVTASTVFGGWSNDSTLPNNAPQPVAAQPGPTVDTHIASGDEVNPVVGLYRFGGDGIEIHQAARELGFSKSGSAWDAPAYLSMKYCVGGGYWAGGSYVSRDGRVWGVAPSNGILGSNLYRLNGSSVEIADWTVFPIRPMLIARGGTNTTKTSIDLSGNPAPSSGATRRKVNFDGTEFRYDDDGTLLDPQPPRAPFIAGTPIYHHQFTGGRNAGNLYVNTESFAWTTINSLRMWLFNMGSSGAVMSNAAGYGSSTTGEFSHVVHPNREWVDVSSYVNPSGTGSGTIRQKLFGASSSSDVAQYSSFLIAYAGCEEMEWHTYPMPPQTLTDQPDERATMAMDIGSTYTVGIAIKRPEGITVKNWGDSYTDRSAGWLCAVYSDASNHIQVRLLDDVTIQYRVTIGGISTDYALSIDAIHQFSEIQLFIESDGSTTTLYARNSKSITFATATAGSIGNPQEIRFGAADWSMVPDIQVLGVYVGRNPVSRMQYVA